MQRNRVSQTEGTSEQATSRRPITYVAAGPRISVHSSLHSTLLREHTGALLAEATHTHELHSSLLNAPTGALLGDMHRSPHFSNTHTRTQQENTQPSSISSPRGQAQELCCIPSQFSSQPSKGTHAQPSPLAHTLTNACTHT